MKKNFLAGALNYNNSINLTLKCVFISLISIIKAIYILKKRQIFDFKSLLWQIISIHVIIIIILDSEMFLFF